MQSLTQNEIAWTAREIYEAAARMKIVSETAATQVERGLARLRAEQFLIIAEKLDKAADGDKRIAIR